MQRNKLFKIGFSTTLILLLALSTFAYSQVPCDEHPWDPWDFPRLDELYMIRKYPAAVGLEAAKAGDLDVFIGAIDPEHVSELSGAPYNWEVSMTEVGGFHMCYHGFNCRDTPPDTAGEYTWFFNRTTNFELYPLNISSFRLALQYVIGITEKAAWIADVYQYINRPQMFYIPFANFYWVNPYLVPYPTDWEMARNILFENGFTCDPGPDDVYNSYDVPSTDDIWYMPNGVKLIGGPDSTSPGSDRYAGLDAEKVPMYGIFVACPGDGLAPPSHEISRRHVRKWNKFFMGVESEGISDHTNTALFIDLPDDTYAYIYFSSFYNRDHDIFMLCWGLGRNPDYLYDLFHPEMDTPGASNSPGLIHEGLDRMLWALKYWKMKDWELLDKNLGDYPEGKAILPSTTYPLPDPLPPVLGVQVERCHKTGVYDEELIENVDYEILPEGLHILQSITLMPGESLEIKFDIGTYHRMILEKEEMRDIVWLVQWKFYYLNPYNPIYSRNYINLFNPSLIQWVDSEGYGSCPETLLMPWTFGHIHWEGQPIGGSVKWHVAGKTESINPILASWVYEMMIINRLFDSLYVVDPYTHLDKPWVATNWEIIPYEAPDVPNGMIIRVTLRDDVRWHDGQPVTAEDVKWNFDFINSTQAPELVALWLDYLGSTVVSTYVVDIYVNVTGMWKAYDFLGNALIFPEQIWSPFWGDYASAIEFEPQDHSYEEWTGNPPPPDKPELTAYIGTGPFWLHFWDYETGVGHLYKNCDYWKRLSNPGDLDIDMDVDEDDLWYFCARFISYYKTGEADIFCDFESDLDIDEDDLWYFCARFIEYYKYGLHGSS